MIDLKMGRPVYTKLIITAFVTSIAFGCFSALNFYVFRELNPIPLKTPPHEGIHFRKSNHPQGIHGPVNIAGIEKNTEGRRPSARGILNNSLPTTGGMLTTWLLNIGLLWWLEKTAAGKRWRAWIRYTASYGAVMLVTIACIYLGVFNGVMPEFPGHVIPGPGNANFIVSGARPVPSFGLRFERSQLPFMTAIVINMIVTAMLELILAQHHKSRTELENARLKMNHLLAKHQQLKQQLQPHFLFNSLQTLKSLIKTSPAAAEDYLVQLSVLLRSSLTSKESAAIPLAEELQLCTGYLDMQKVRYGNAFHFVVQIPETIIATVSVPAFSLQLLVENAIKHNVLTVENPLTIHIGYNEDGYIEVKNNKRIKAAGGPLSGIGLANLSERYKMIADHGIVVIDNENDFIVKIKTLKK